MPRQRARKPLAEMARVLPLDIANVLQRLSGRFARRPARDVALWLACIPLVLPAPVIAGGIAFSERIKGDRDARWWLVIALSVVNFVLSAVAITWIFTLFGGWMVDQLNGLFGPFFLWPADPSPRPIPV